MTAHPELLSSNKEIIFRFYRGKVKVAISFGTFKLHEASYHTPKVLVMARRKSAHNITFVISY
jgi:hypothetical protein